MDTPVRKLVSCTLMVCFAACATDARVKTHPDPDTRIEAINKTIKTMQRDAQDPNVK